MFYGFENFINYLKERHTTRELLYFIYSYYVQNVEYDYNQLQIVKIQNNISKIKEIEDNLKIINAKHCSEGTFTSNEEIKDLINSRKLLSKDELIAYLND